MTSKPSLDGVRAKIARSRHHLDALSSSIDAWFAAEAALGELEHVHNPDGLTHEWWPVGALEIPIDWAVICGDAIHNGRAALDHLVWQLVIANGMTPDDRNAFPVAWHRPTARKPMRGVHGLARRVVDDIDRMQPYHVGPYPSAAAPLGQLADLSNVDKHRTLLTSVAVRSPLPVDGVSVVFVEDGCSVVSMDLSRAEGKPYGSAPAVSLRLDPPDAQHVVAIDGFGLGVLFGDARMTRMDLRGLVDWVERVVDHFASTVGLT